MTAKECTGGLTVVCIVQLEGFPTAKECFLAAAAAHQIAVDSVFTAHHLEELVRRAQAIEVEAAEPEDDEDADVQHRVHAHIDSALAQARRFVSTLGYVQPAQARTSVQGAPGPARMGDAEFAANLASMSGAQRGVFEVVQVQACPS